MRAVWFEEYGGPEVLRLGERAAPEPGPGEVSLDVAWAGVNFADAKSRSVGYRVSGFPFVPGLDVSGRVRALGEGVTGLAVGQPVAALLAGGGYAEVAVAKAGLVFPLSEAADLRLAAALPTVLPTAHALVHDVARLRAGESILVQGAAGGVGTVVGQVAARAGAGAVYGVASSAEKAAYAMDFGYTAVFGPDDFDKQVLEATEGRGVDVLLDPVGGETWSRGLAALARYGRALSFGNASGAAPWTVDQAALIGRGLGVYGFSLLSLAADAPEQAHALGERSFRAVAEGAIRVPVTAEFPLADAAAAHRLLESRASTGKLLIQVAG